MSLFDTIQIFMSEIVVLTTIFLYFRPKNSNFASINGVFHQKSVDNLITDWLPTSAKEVQMRGWEQLDVIMFSGDAYVDHPSFGAAVIGRVLEAEGYRVAIVPQPNWRDDLRDFKKLGKPRLFFGVSPGAMDSMVNH